MGSGPTEQPLCILMISVHGLVRGHHLELGCDADTGGQITYVVELSRALARQQEVERVDLLTRLVDDPALSADYARPEEDLGGGARILRLPCGPRRYLRKELLWRHLDEMVDRCLCLLRRQGHLPDLIHSHYADAGYVGQRLSLLLGVPQVHTGHSLGRVKRERLLAGGRTERAIERQFNFARRIGAEESVLGHASLVVASTQQEIAAGYSLYENHDPGRSVVIPPGLDTSRFSPPGTRAVSDRARRLVDRFFCQPLKPLILTISRPVQGKNLIGLFDAYGGAPVLQKTANLAIVAGKRDDIGDLDEAQQKVVTELLLGVDRHDLWGKVALPKHHAPDDAPELYRLAAERGGVFVNPALTESFGLTLIEATASGLPLVCTQDGGPREIIESCHNGLLVDPLDAPAIAGALSEVLADEEQWHLWAQNGLAAVRRHYTWEAHVRSYLKEVRHLLRRDRKRRRRQLAAQRDGDRPRPPLPPRMLISDLDSTLIGEREALQELLNWLRTQVGAVGFGIATGRTLESALELLEQWCVPMPDVLITAVGSEISYGPALRSDSGWANHMRYRWRRDALADVLAAVPGLRLQPEENQRGFKLSYEVSARQLPPLEHLYCLVRARNLHARLVYSRQESLDVLPVRASKGHAVRYLANKWDLPLSSFLVAGDSGNDAEMLKGETLAVVVGNHGSELLGLCDLGQVFFAARHCAGGIVEGLEHYGWWLDRPRSLGGFGP